MSIFGILKPKGPTSHDIVRSIKKITNTKKVGHAGTLDPLASGVLVVGVGRESTKKLSVVVKKEKEYLAKIKLGYISTTDDAEGKKEKIKTKEKSTKKEIEKVVKKFIGRMSQIPPLFSAVKVKGKEAYKRARAGEEVKLKARRVNIKSIRIIKYKWPSLELKVITGPGVYIRALARDIGKSLGVGGYLAGLERTRVGEFTKKKSLTQKQFQKQHYILNNNTK